jgi:hypothetical protein
VLHQKVRAALAVCGYGLSDDDEKDLRTSHPRLKIEQR